MLIWWYRIQRTQQSTINGVSHMPYTTYHIIRRVGWYTILCDTTSNIQHTYSMTVKHNATKYYNREGSRFVFSQQSTKFHMKWNMHYWAVGLIVRLHAPWKKWMMRNITYVWHHTQTRVEWKVGCISWRAAMVTWNDGRCKFPSPITEPTMNNVLANVSLDI